MEELQPVRWKMVAWDESRRDGDKEQIQNTLEIKVTGLANGLHVEHKGERNQGTPGFGAWAASR